VSESSLASPPCFHWLPLVDTVDIGLHASGQSLEYRQQPTKTKMGKRARRQLEEGMHV
jgi:hypothetical protein